jgi:nucleoid DNA-binding protein
MNKGEFVDFIANKNKSTKVDVQNVINVFTNSVISALSEGKEVNLTGFGSFYANKTEARTGRNPKTGAEIKIKAMNQPKFSAGQKLKDACNKK